MHGRPTRRASSLKQLHRHLGGQPPGLIGAHPWRRQSRPTQTGAARRGRRRSPRPNRSATPVPMSDACRPPGRRRRHGVPARRRRWLAGDARSRRLPVEARAPDGGAWPPATVGGVGPRRVPVPRRREVLHVRSVAGTARPATRPVPGRSPLRHRRRPGRDGARRARRAAAGWSGGRWDGARCRCRRRCHR